MYTLLATLRGFDCVLLCCVVCVLLFQCCLSFVGSFFFIFLSVALPKDNIGEGFANWYSRSYGWYVNVQFNDVGGGPLAHPLHRHRFCGLFDFFIHHFNVYASFHSATTKKTQIHRLRTNDVGFSYCRHYSVYALTTTVIVLTVSVYESVYGLSIIHGKHLQQKKHAWLA